MGAGTGDPRPPMNGKNKLRIDWYRCPIETQKLRELTRRSDAMGFFFTLGQLVLFGGTGYLAHFFFVRQLWLLMALTIWVHGIMRSVGFSGNHELSHGTVFRTKWLNATFLRLWALQSWFNFHRYKMSHTYHHLYTLHPDGDGEVVLPRNFSLKALTLLQKFTFDFAGFARVLYGTIRVAVTGRFHDEWSERIYTEEQSKPFRRAIRWSRILLIVHISVAIVSVVIGLPMISLLFSLGGFVGTWWIFFIGGTMHAGLRDNVPDFRKCTRTIKLDPFSGYLRWNMHYHIEHHMFAAVPCYNLGKLYRAVADDMPKRRSLIEAWREMRETERRQRADPSYQFDTPVPPPAAARNDQDALGAEIGDIRPKDYVGQTPVDQKGE